MSRWWEYLSDAVGISDPLQLLVAAVEVLGAAALRSRVIASTSSNGCLDLGIWGNGERRSRDRESHVFLSAVTRSTFFSFLVVI
jgi:hypothetical protein